MLLACDIVVNVQLEGNKVARLCNGLEHPHLQSTFTLITRYKSTKHIHCGDCHNIDFLVYNFIVAYSELPSCKILMHYYGTIQSSTQHTLFLKSNAHSRPTAST
jgi:hypothetical protein